MGPIGRLVVEVFLCDILVFDREAIWTELGMWNIIWNILPDNPPDNPDNPDNPDSLDNPDNNLPDNRPKLYENVQPDTWL